MRRMSPALTWATVAVASGCGVTAATTPPALPDPLPYEFRVGAPLERVWSALLLTYTDLNMPVENMDHSSWFMRSQEQIAPKTQALYWADCGTEALKQRAGNDFVDVFARITTLLRPVGDSTAVRLNVSVRGFDTWDAVHPGAPPPNLRCVSLGVLERRVEGLMRARM